MKKNIVIAVLAVTTLLSLMYGYVQRAEAYRQRALAEQSRQLMEVQLIEAERQRKIAEEQHQRLVVALSETHQAMEETLRQSNGK